MTDSRTPRTTREKLAIFRACFSGLTHAYGTYDPATGRARQAKEPVTDDGFLRHLRGIQPYGVYLLVEDRTRALAVDFDSEDLNAPMEFLAAAKNQGLATYIERSKSKGYHVWMFFEEDGVLAGKARRVAQNILHRLGMPGTEVFPKQDLLDGPDSYGNFINAPLFGSLVPRGRTVFVDETNPSEPCMDQWEFLGKVQRISEDVLDDILARVEETQVRSAPSHQEPPSSSQAVPVTFGLPPCARRMLAEGVTEDQRVACFHLALQLRKAGLPQDIVIASLRAWALKNRPNGNRRIITPEEIAGQTRSAYGRAYRGCGCEAPSVMPYCDPLCPLKRHAHVPSPGGVDPCSGEETEALRSAHEGT
jgi:hypothetical protein